MSHPRIDKTVSPPRCLNSSIFPKKSEPFSCSLVEVFNSVSVQVLGDGMDGGVRPGGRPGVLRGSGSGPGSGETGDGGVGC